MVGGAVRNTLLALPHGDIDIATTAVPQEVMRRAEAAGFKAVPTGIDHGTVTVVIGGRPFEVTTLREDVETFGRHATVKFGRDWKRDAERRDFTMNALFVSADGTVHDFVGGLADLEKRHVRFIGDAATRIAEDYLRILRFFRFHAYYGEGAPDADGLHAAIQARAGLDQLSRERVRMELIKLLVAPRAGAGACRDGGDGPARRGARRRAAARELCQHGEGGGGDASLRPTRRAGSARSMCGSSKMPSGCGSGCGCRMPSARGSPRWRHLVARVAGDGRRGSARTDLSRSAPTISPTRALLAWSRSEASAHDAAWRDLATLPSAGARRRSRLRAADFIARGMEKGPVLGSALARSEEMWIRDGFPMERKALDRIVNEALGG